MAVNQLIITAVKVENYGEWYHAIITTDDGMNHITKARKNIWIGLEGTTLNENDMHYVGAPQQACIECQKTGKCDWENDRCSIIQGGVL
jgi:hypothetical protein